jgi:hypothetical protein
MPAKRKTQNVQAENASANQTVSDNQTSNSNGSKRGRKPAPFSVATMREDIRVWRNSGGKVLPEKYTVIPAVTDDKGWNKTYEIVSSPEFIRQRGNLVDIVTLQTDGSFEYNVKELVRRTFEYDGKNFVEIQKPATK